MDRRDFFRILGVSSAGALAGCGSQPKELVPLLVPEHEIVPGEEQWHPAVCTECTAGCGTIVRMMSATRSIERDGQPMRQRIAAVKKIEGNPLDPVSGGRLCARGQAVVQGLYHPDRLKGPMKRSGNPGEARFSPVTWDEALAAAAEKILAVHSSDPASIAILTGPTRGTRSLALERFAKALGAPAPVVCSLADYPVERKAAEMVFGWKGLPVYDLANAHHALGVGADFLGGWASPVYYARQYGSFRQGRSAVRGYLAHAESRLSLTATSADRWLPLLPGTEPQFLLAVGSLLLAAKTARNAKELPAAVNSVFQSADPARLLADCGLPEARVREVVDILGQSEAPLVFAGASNLHTNSLDALVDSHYVNLMLGNIGRKGGVLPPAAPLVPAAESYRVTAALAHARVILLDDANPAYSLPAASGVADALSHAEMVIGFSSLLDDSGAYANLLLPSPHTLESAVVVTSQAGAAIATPFVEPLYQTRPLETTLADLARKIFIDYQAVTASDTVQPLLGKDLSFDDAARQGGAWPAQNYDGKYQVAGKTLDVNPAAFDGDASRYPLTLQPYLSLQFHDGRGSHLPWLQELPDPVSSSIWGLPVEIDPKTAQSLGVTNGDVVRVESAHGKLEAPAYVHPGAIPGVVSMAIGDGHAHYSRYATGRGANPLAILAPVWEKSTGQLAMGGTRVRLARAGGRGDWIQFSTPEREEIDFGKR